MAGMFVVNVEVAVHREGRWLMVERSAKEVHAAGALAMPGGTVEYEDADAGTLESCAHREVREEVGVTLHTDLRYVESKQFHSARGRQVINVVFLAEHESGEAAVQDTDEAAWAGWLSLADVLADDRAPVWLKASLTAAEQTHRGGNP